MDGEKKVINCHNLCHHILMPRRSSIEKDFTVAAGKSAAHAIGEQFSGEPFADEDEGKNPHAVALGRLGGKIGGKARAKALSKTERRRIASMAAKARWHGK